MNEILRAINGNKTYYVAMAGALTYAAMAAQLIPIAYFYPVTGIVASLLAATFRSALKAYEPSGTVDEAPVEVPVSGPPPVDVAALIDLMKTLLLTPPPEPNKPLFPIKDLSELLNVEVSDVIKKAPEKK